MMDLATIRAASRKAAAYARAEKKLPYIVEKEDIEDFRSGAGFPFPMIGNYVPAGWKKINTYFVDSSGFGAEFEPALTVSSFIEKLVIGHGYAITEAGQFQVYVAEYVRI